MGPRTEHFGTLLNTSAHVERLSATPTRCLRLLRLPNPLQYRPQHSVCCQFNQESLMWNSIESFGKIQEYYMQCSSLVHAG